MAHINVEVNGLVFTDSDELGAYLNISPNTLLAMLNRGYSITEIIEHNKLLWPIAERRRLRQATPTATGNHRSPCTIAGKTYPSQAAAARAYHVPIQTIYSRMQRQNLSFEDAILCGYREEHLLSPVPELYSAYRDQLQPCGELDCNSLSDFLSVLDAAGFTCSTMQTSDHNLQAIKTDFGIREGLSIELWLLYLRDKEFLEVMTPALARANKQDVELLNKLNRQTANIRFWYQDDDQIAASFGEKFRAATESAKYTLRSFYQFLGACDLALGIIKQPG